MPKKDIVIIENKEIFKERVETRMKTLGIKTNQELANLLEIDKQLLHHYLQSGRIPVETFKHIAFYLACTESFLLGQSDDSTIEIKDEKEMQMLVQYQIADIAETEVMQLLKNKTFEMHQIINFLKSANPKEISQLLRFMDSFENIECCSFTSQIATRFYHQVFNEAFIDTLAHEHTLERNKDLKREEKEKRIYNRFNSRFSQNYINFAKKVPKKQH